MQVRNYDLILKEAAISIVNYASIRIANHISNQNYYSRKRCNSMIINSVAAIYWQLQLRFAIRIKKNSTQLYQHT